LPTQPPPQTTKKWRVLFATNLNKYACIDSGALGKIFYLQTPNSPNMPELPDLQVFSGNLHKKLKGLTVTKMEVPVTKKLKTTKAALTKALEGAAIKTIYREGKELHIAFSNDHVLGLHLMLHGGLQLFEGSELPKHTIIALFFDDKTGLALTDYSGMATPTLDPEEKTAPDAISKDVTLAFLKEKLRSKAAIKNVLLNQKVLRGIGNAYADEILWDAGISPFSISNKIPDDAIKALKASITKVLANAEKQIKKANPDIISGELRDFLLIHNAKQKQSPTGSPILQKTGGGRKTYYTEEQELYR
jgi:formamidopyrimidine-DNA glycosylase